MVVINQESFDEMLADAAGSFPDECCGFIYGKEEGDLRLIEKIRVVNNAKEGDKRRRFEISPLDYLKAEQFAEDQGLQLLGVYHSHPNHPAVASETDRLSAQPYFSYVILSIVDSRFAEIRSWRLNDDRQFEEEIISKNYITT